MHPLCFLSPLAFGVRGPTWSDVLIQFPRLGRFISVYIFVDSFWGLLIGPFMLSFETTCSEVERPMVLTAKIIHLATWDRAMKAIDTGVVGCYVALCFGQLHGMLEASLTTQVSTVAYLFFAAAHFLYSPLNPWPEILKQRRKRLGKWRFWRSSAGAFSPQPMTSPIFARFKLLSHKAEVLHPALVQQLHARGGPEEETNHTEATKNPLTSLRFWVPIFDGLVLPGIKQNQHAWLNAVALFGMFFFWVPIGSPWHSTGACVKNQLRLLGFVAEIVNMTKQPSRTPSATFTSHWSVPKRVHVNSCDFTQMRTYWKTLNNSTSNLKTRIEGWSHWAPSSDILPQAFTKPNKKTKRHTHRVPHHHGELIIIFQQQNPEAWILVTARGFRLVVPPSDIVVSNFWTVAGRSVSFKGRLDVGTLRKFSLRFQNSKSPFLAGDQGYLSLGHVAICILAAQVWFCLHLVCRYMNLCTTVCKGKI